MAPKATGKKDKVDAQPEALQQDQRLIRVSLSGSFVQPPVSLKEEGDLGASEGRPPLSSLPPTVLHDPYFQCALGGAGEPYVCPPQMGQEFAFDFFEFRVVPTDSKDIINFFCRELPASLLAAPRPPPVPLTPAPPTTASSDAKGKGKDSKKDAPAPKPKGKGADKKDAAQKGPETHVPVATFSFSLSPLLFGDTTYTQEYRNNVDEQGNPKCRQEVPFLRTLTVTVKIADDKGPLLTPELLKLYVPMGIEVRSMVDMPPSSAGWAGRSYEELDAKCLGPYISVHWMNGMPPLKTAHFKHMRHIGMFQKFVLLLGSLPAFTGGAVASIFEVLRYWSQNVIRAEVHDRDPRDSKQTLVPFGYVEIAMHTMLNGVLEMKLREQVLSSRDTRVCVGAGTYMEYASMVHVSVRVAESLPAVQFVEVPKVIAIEPPKEPQVEAPKSAGKDSRKDLKRLKTPEEEEKKEVAPLPKPVEVPLLPDPNGCFTRMIVTMPYAVPMEVLTAVLSTVVKYQKAVPKLDEVVEFRRDPLPEEKPPAEKEPAKKEEKGKPTAKKGKKVAEEEEPVVEVAPPPPTLTPHQQLKARKAQAKAAKQRTRANLTLSSTNTVSGFEVMDGEKRYWVLEGMANTFLREVKESLSKFEAPYNIRIVFNPEQPILERLYHSWGEALARPPEPALPEPAPEKSVDELPKGKGKDSRDIKSAKGKEKEKEPEKKEEPKLEEVASNVNKDSEQRDLTGVGGRLRRIKIGTSIESLHKHPEHYLKRKLPPQVLALLDSIVQLGSVRYITEAVERRIFPSTSGLLQLERIFGATISNQDQSGAPNYIIHDGIPQVVKEEEVKVMEMPVYVSREEEMEIQLKACSDRLKRCMDAVHAKPTHSGELLEWIGQDVVVDARVPRGDEVSVLGDPREILGNDSGLWMYVPSMSTYLLFMFPDLPIPAKTVKYTLDGQLVSYMSNGGSAGVAVKVVTWREAVHAVTDHRNPEFVARKTAEKHALPHTHYKTEMKRREKEYYATHTEKAKELEELKQSSLKGEYVRYGDKRQKGPKSDVLIVRKEDEGSDSDTDIHEEPVLPASTAMDVRKDFVHLNANKFRSPYSSALRERENEFMQTFTGEIYNYSTQSLNVVAFQRQALREEALKDPNTVRVYGDTVAAFDEVGGAEGLFRRAAETPELKKREREFTLLKKPDVFNDNFESVHVTSWGPGAVKEAVERQRREREDWLARVVVDDIHFKAHYSGAGRKKPQPLDKLEGMLKGPPKKQALKHSYVPPIKSYA